MKLLRCRSCLLPFTVLALLPLSAQTNTFPASGNVGVGTTSPASALQANGSVYVTSRTVPTSGAGLELFYSGGLSYLLSYDRANSLYKSLAFDASEQVFTVNGSEKMRLASNGTVGIGVTTPPASLTIQDSNGLDTQNKGALMFTYDQSGNYRNAVVNRFAGGQASNSKMMFRVSDGSTTSMTDVMTLLGSGNVGVGTTSPSAKLEVVGQIRAVTTAGIATVDLSGSSNGYAIDIANNQFIRFANTSGSLRLGLGVSVDNNVYLLSPIGGDIKLNPDVSATTGLVVRATTGNVGIGTTNPTQKLSVNGTIQAKEVIVQTGWSDYVFDDGYKLPALSEVEQRIKVEHHLPGIPSAAQVAKEGIPVGEMQSKLLAKIEELTLHQIEQEKRLNSQSDRLQKLETENTALRASHHD